jgi:hypothetical protein
MSNSKAIFIGGTTIRVLNLLANGEFSDSQNVITSIAVTTVKISYFNNWLFAGT